MSPQKEIVTELLRRFPKTPSLTLAKMAYRDNPSVFTTVDAARASVRFARGAKRGAGGRSRDQTHFRPLQLPADPFGKMPKGKTHFNDWESFKMPGQAKALILSDLHIPYHDDEALTVAVKHGRKMGCDTILLNGDTADFFSCSFWEKDPRQRDFATELSTVRAVLDLLRQQFRQARIIFKHGNHEERWERYLRVKAPELLGVEDFELKTLLRFDKLGIEEVTDKRPIKLGKLNVIHGHEYRFSISNPVNPARGFFLRAKVHCLGSHLHMTSQHSEKNLEEHVVSTWSTGCLCDLHPDYSPLNPWNHGFAVVEIDNKERFHVHNLKIIDGKVY